MCTKENNPVDYTPVPDFTKVGVESESALLSTKAQKTHESVLALGLSVCVGASYNPSTNKICFTIPIYGDYCITSPIQIPVGGQLKACAKTCGSFIPTGLKATLYLDDKEITTVVLFGSC